MKPHKWVSMLGEYELIGETLVFKGGTAVLPDQQVGSNVGNFVCDQEFGGGTIGATIIFKEDASGSGAGIILYYQPSTGAFVEVQLGGAALVSVATFSGQQWATHASIGPSSQLVPDQPYDLQARVSGSRVIVTLDGIQVLDVTLPFTLPQGQTGIWANGRSDITFSDYEVKAERPNVFVVMKFTAPFDDLYADVIKPVGEELGFVVARADETHGPGITIADIAQSILEAKVVIADITPLDAPNVFWEVGYAHALRKPTILIAERSTLLPFDISPFRTLFYDNTIPGKSQIEDGLRKHFSAIQAEWSAI